MSKAAYGWSRWAGLGWLALPLLAVVVGCRPTGFKTYPVEGKVVMPKAEDQERLKGRGSSFSR